MRLAQIRAEVRSQRYGIAVGALALLVAVGAPAHAVDGVTSAATSVGKTLKLAKRADKRSKRALSLARKVDRKPGVKGEAGARGPKGDTGAQGAQGAQGLQGSAGSDAEFNGAAAGGSLTGTYPDPTLAPGVVGSSELAPNLNDMLDQNDIATGGIGGLEIASSAIRADDLPAVDVESTSVVIPGGTEGNGDATTRGGVATCNAGGQAISGGSDWLDTMNGGDDDDEELYTVESQLLTDSSWKARGANDTDQDHTFRVLIYCLIP